MTEREAERIFITLNMNFAAFVPREMEEAAVKRGLWLKELMKYDFADGLKAANQIIQTSPYPPTIYDFKAAVGINPELTREEAQARLPGPTFDSKEGMQALYTCDMDRVNRLMADLDKELAGMPGLERTRR